MRCRHLRGAVRRCPAAGGKRCGRGGRDGRPGQHGAHQGGGRTVRRPHPRHTGGVRGRDRKQDRPVLRSADARSPGSGGQAAAGGRAHRPGSAGGASRVRDRSVRRRAAGCRSRIRVRPDHRGVAAADGEVAAGCIGLLSQHPEVVGAFSRREGAHPAPAARHEVVRRRRLRRRGLRVLLREHSEERGDHRDRARAPRALSAGRRADDHAGHRSLHGGVHLRGSVLQRDPWRLGTGAGLRSGTLPRPVPRRSQPGRGRPGEVGRLRDLDGGIRGPPLRPRAHRISCRWPIASPTFR